MRIAKLQLKRTGERIDMNGWHFDANYRAFDDIASCAEFGLERSLDFDELVLIQAMLGEGRVTALTLGREFGYERVGHE